jgi:DNA mismatch endonuclease, patch repair protein
MTDVFTREKRSQVMSAIRGRGNKDTELSLMTLLRRYHIRGWRRHLLIPGSPDFVFRREKVAIFVDGCFWHMCPRHFSMPKNNRTFWKKKLEGNAIRDKAVNLELRKKGWKVIRVWEHQLRTGPSESARRILNALIRRRAEMDL